MPRLRTIYQTDLLYVGPTGQNPATGALQGGAQWGNISGSIASGTSYISELYRIQKVDDGFSRKLKVLSEFGQLGVVDLVPIEPPDVTLSISYVLANLANENLMGLNVNKAGDTVPVPCLSGILLGELPSSTATKNYFLKTTSEGSDAINTNPNDYDVISFGNAFIASYSSQGRVLDFPTVDVSLVALNMQAQHVWQQNTGGYAITPAVYPGSGTYITGWGYILPTGTTSFNSAGLANVSGLSVLRPGDMFLNLGLNPGDGFFAPQDIKIQSYNLSFNLQLEDLTQLGSKYYYAKLPRFPVEATLTIDALAGDIQSGTLVEITNNNLTFNPSITINQPGTSNPVVFYQLAGAKIDSENSSMSIGSNKTVNIQFRSTIGGPNDTVHNVFMSGICANI
jgi:hypothetical protein